MRSMKSIAAGDERPRGDVSFDCSKSQHPFISNLKFSRLSPV